MLPQNARRAALFRALAGLSTGLLLSACASTGDSVALAPQPASAAQATAAATSTGGYTLTAEEQGLDCKKLSGRMQVRIVQMRGFATRQQTSTVSQSLQVAAINVFGGSREGTDPAGHYAHNRAMLEAFNRQLAAKNCRTFDLDAALKEPSTAPTPEPLPKEKPKPAQ